MKGETDILENWKRITLKQASSKIVVGYVGLVSTEIVESDGIKFLSTTHIGENEFLPHNIRLVSKSFNDKNKKSQVIPGDIIIARHGDSGKACIIPDNIDIAQVSNAVILRPNIEVVIPKFICYRLNAERQRMQKSKVGGVFQVVNTRSMESFQLDVPSIKLQTVIIDKIEELFSEIDKGIEEIKAAQQQLKVYRQAVLKWAFEGKLTNENVVEGKLPEGWKEVKIEAIAESLDHKRKPINKAEREQRKGNIPYYGANGRTGWIDDYLFDEPLILVVEDETFVGRELPFSYKITGKAWVNNHAHILRPKNGNSLDFLNYQLFFYPFLKIVTGTTGRKKLTKNALMNAPVKICSIDEQQQIVQEIESRLSVCDKIEETITNSLKQAEALKQSVLKKAFGGKLI